MPWCCFSCLNDQTADIKELNYRHCTITDVPSEVFVYERTLEELYLDSNRIRDLPRQLFHCHGLKTLTLSDNEVRILPPAVSSLVNLQHLDVSRNALSSIPDTIKACKHLIYLDVSVNPLERLPEGFTQLITLEELYLNDTYIDFLPANFGRLSKLRILELRENNLNTLPKSIGRLTHLQRLDLGQNEFSDLPEVIGNLPNLTELWIDSNRIRNIPMFIGNLKKLIHLEASNNLIRWIAPDIGNCVKIVDLTLSCNELQEIPDSIGNLNQLVTFKLDDNQMLSLPNSIGKLDSLEELILSQNDLEKLNPCVGLLRKMHILNVDDNMLEELPPEIGSCTSLTILSAHSNKLQRVPAELGHLYNLLVINLSENQLENLPVSILNLNQLTALWLSNNQSTPLTMLQQEVDKETGQTVCINFMLPQCSQETHLFEEAVARQAFAEEGVSHKAKQHITFANDDDSESPSRLLRAPTPYPKELRAMAKHARAVQPRRLLLKESEEVAPLLSRMVCQEPKDVLIKEAKVKKPGRSTAGSSSDKEHEDSPSNDETDLQIEESPWNIKMFSRDTSFPVGQGTSGEVTPVIAMGSGPVVREAIYVKKYSSQTPSSIPSAITSTDVKERHSIASTSELALQQPPPYHIAAAYSKQAVFFRQSELQDTGPSPVQEQKKDEDVPHEEVEETVEDFEHPHDDAVHGEFHTSACSKLETYLLKKDIEDGSQIAYVEDSSEMYKSKEREDTLEEFSSCELGLFKTFTSSTALVEAASPSDEELHLDSSPLTGFVRDDPVRSNVVTLVRAELENQERLPVDVETYQQKVMPTTTKPIQVFETDIQSESVQVFESDAQCQMPESSANTAITTPDIDMDSKREVLLMQEPQTFTQDKPIVSESVIAPTPQRPSSGSPSAPESLGFVPAPSRVIPVASSPNLVREQSVIPIKKVVSKSIIPKSTARVGSVPSLIPSTRLDSKQVPIFWSPSSTRIPQPGFYSSSSNYSPSKRSAPCSPTLNLSDTTIGIESGSNSDAGNDSLKEQSLSTTKIPLLSSRTEMSPRAGSVQHQTRIPTPSSSLPSSPATSTTPDVRGKNTKTWMFGPHKNATVFPVRIQKNPGLGFSISGGYKSSITEKSEYGIFITKVHPNGPASLLLLPDDKILEVNGTDFTKLDHEHAVEILKQTGNVVNMMISRQQT